jgi:integrase
MTFRRCAEAYIEANRAAWKNRVHAQQWPKTLEAFVFPLIGDLPVQAIDTGLVLRVLEPIWQTRTETASRVRGRIESVLNYAKVKELRDGENPARWRGHLDNILPKRSRVRAVQHHAAVPYAEIGALMEELRQVDSRRQAQALEFTVLTAARTGEVIGARWDEINVAERVWTIPADRMKGGREHRVPLSDRALEIIKRMAALPETSDFIFPGRYGRPLAQTTLLVVLNRLRAGATVHGMRSCFRDWVSERTNYPSDLAELCLAHSVGTKVEQAYRRGDMFGRRRRLMEDWANFCAEPAPAAAKVIAIGDAR